MVDSVMVVLDGVRYPREFVNKHFPDRAKDAKPADVEPTSVFDPVSTAPGAVVTGEDAGGNKIINTDASGAGNAPVPDTKHEGGGDGSPGETVGSGDADKAAGKRPAAGTRTNKGK